MTDKTWKQAEREVARILEGRRVPVSGRQRGDAPDVSHSELSIDVKHRKTLPSWLLDAMDQANASSRGTQLPIAVLHQRGSQYEHCLVVVELGPFSRFISAAGANRCGSDPGTESVRNSGQH
jgi:hypothetical protein